MKILKNYSLSWFLFLIFAVCLGLHAIFEWREYNDEQIEKNKPVQIHEYINKFGRAVFENLQSEYAQLLSFVLLSAYLIHKGSPQSKDGDDEMRRELAEARRELAEIKQLLTSKEKSV